MTPQQISDLLGLNGDVLAQFTNPFSELGKMYRRIIAQRTKELHEKTLELANVGSPTAIDEANRYLRDAQVAIDY